MTKKFSIDTPPPTVSGQLHMGHVFSYSHADFIARYQRMKGLDVFYPIGFDDNGLPTERLVEKEKKIRGSDYEKAGKKEEFIKECQSVVEEAEKEFEKLFKTLGYSYDWNLKYQTISDSSAKIAQSSFKDLVDKGLIYQAYGPVYWDVIDQTALANADIEDKEQDGFECYLEFPICDENGKETGNSVKIMTTRPEMLPACLAVMYNPNHENAKKFKGKFSKVPLTDLKVPLIEDETISLDKGTGAMMVCSYGDWHDVELINKHNLKMHVIISKDGEILKNFYKVIFKIETEQDNQNFFKTPQKAREAVIKYCEDNNLFSRPKNPIKQIVKVGERSKFPVEIIETNQFYVTLKAFKEDFRLISKHIKFHPEHMRNRLEQWIDAIDRDWCISRDRFMGIDIPFENTNQVFDTWFTSSCTPQINSRFLNENFDDGKKFSLPMSMRTQSHEIIRTWAFYTIVKAYFHGLTKDEIEERISLGTDSGKIQNWFEKKGFNNYETVCERGLIPWENVVLSGWCLASDKTKMSKSKGNIVTPQGLIEEKGVDTIRYWAASSHLGVDTPYNETKFADAKRLITKLENATKFSLMVKNNANFVLPYKNLSSKMVTEEFDKWILFKFFNVLKKYEEEFENFEYAKAKDLIEKFFWADFCDNYLEIIKVRSYGLGAFIYKDKNLAEEEKNSILNAQKSAVVTLAILIDGILKLFAPFLIKKTDELYKQFSAEFSIENQDVHAQGNWINEELLILDFSNFENCEKLIELIDFIRRRKSELKLSMKAEISQILCPFKIPTELEFDFRAVANAINAKILEGEKEVVFAG